MGLALSVASGLTLGERYFFHLDVNAYELQSLGKEGPFVHIASCIGNIVSRYFSKYETNEGASMLLSFGRSNSNCFFFFLQVKDARFFRPRLQQGSPLLLVLRSAVFCSAWKKSPITSHRKSCGKGKTLEACTIAVTDSCVLTSLQCSFFCAMIAAITLRFLDPFGTGKLVLFQVTYDKVRVFPWDTLSVTHLCAGLARV